MTIQTRCGNCHYKYNMELAKRSTTIRIKKKEQSKTRLRWSKAKRIWIADNPAVDGLWYCHYCGVPLTLEEDLLDMGVQYLTLDHMKPRSSHVDLRFEQENLVPCCLLDNDRKGSRSYESYCSEFYPNLVVDSN